MEGPNHSRLPSGTLFGDLILESPNLGYRLRPTERAVALRRSLVNKPVDKLSMSGFVNGKHATTMLIIVWISIMMAVLKVL